MVIITSKYYYPCCGFLTPQYQTVTNPLHGISWIDYPTEFFLEIGRNYVSVIITILDNTTVLVSHNILCL